MTTKLTTKNLREPNVIAKLNTKITNKKIIWIHLKNESDPIVSLCPVDFDFITLQNKDTFLSISGKPYFHIMLYYADFTHIEVRERD